MQMPWRLEQVGHSLLSDPNTRFAECVVRADGSYALLGSKSASDGSVLVDLSNPGDPRESHRLAVDDGAIAPDVKFGARDGLYYGALEDEGGGVDVVDYGFGDATPSEPTVLATLDTGDTHNMFPLPEQPLVYATNTDNGDTPGIDVWDVSDPADPERVGQGGPDGRMHDVVVDGDRKLAHCAYTGGDFEGYAILDVSDGRNPATVGQFDYEDRPDYADRSVGEAAFENCHYAAHDPRRGLVVVGDEIETGNPGGKHIFDIGWDQGSPEEPVPVGFTLSPNARPIGQDEDAFAWTGHNFDVVPRGADTLLVSGDYKEGAVLYDITDPRAPQGIDWYPTDDGANEVTERYGFDGPPRAWSSHATDDGALAVTADVFTGIYVFRIVRNRRTNG